MTNVVLSVTSSNTGNGTVAPSTLTFTNANWNVAQTVTITGVDDSIDQVVDDTANIIISVVDASSFDAYDPLPDKTVVATFTDDDSAGLNVSKSALTVGENGGTGTFTVKLNTTPTSNVVLSVTSSAVAEGTVSPSTLTFTPANWNVAQTVTVTGVDDFADTIADDTANITISVVDASSDDVYDPFPDSIVATTFTDNDTAGITVSKTTMAVGENAGTNTFTVVLNAQPLTNVVVSLTSSDILQGTVAPATLTFTSANWNTAQTVTVTGVNDAVDTLIDDTANITVSIVDASSYDTYDPVPDKTVAVTFTDDDTAGYTVSASNLTVGENGGTGTFTVVLNTQPISNVVISLTSGSLGEATVSPATLTFTPVNWSTAQTVTVTGVNDNVDTPANDTSVITVSIVDASSDNQFDPLADKTVNVTATDDDVADFVVLPTTLNVGENAGTGAISVKLSTQPQSNVVINVSSSSTAEGTVSPSTLTFTPVNWAISQSVTVTGVDDFINTPVNSTSNIVFSVNDASSDNQYDPITDKTVVATFIDDDKPGFTINVVNNVTTESGATGSFKVRLNSQPTANVTLPLSSSNTGEGTISISSLTFTPANWNVDQTVIVTGVDDAPPVADGSVNYNIVTGDPTSTDLQYNVLTATDVVDIAMSNQNNDSVGVTLSLTGNTTEAGGTASVSFVLLSQPTADVTIPLSISNPAEGSISVSSITITPANWNVGSANKVTITGVDDFVVDGNIIYKLVTGDPTSVDPNYDALTPTDLVDVSITNNDNDSAGVVVT